CPMNPDAPVMKTRAGASAIVARAAASADARQVRRALGGVGAHRDLVDLEDARERAAAAEWEEVVEAQERPERARYEHVGAWALHRRHHGVRHLLGLHPLRAPA